MANFANRRSCSNVRRVHVSVTPLGRAWGPLGVLRLVSLRTSRGKRRSDVTPVHVSYKVAQIEQIGLQIMQIPNVPQTLHLCRFL